MKLLNRVIGILFLLSVEALFAQEADAAETMTLNSSASFEIESYEDVYTLDDLKIFLFQAGDDLAYAEPDFDDSAWELIAAPESIYDKLEPKDQPFWYRIHLTFPEDYSSETIAVFIEEFFDVDITYFNGVEIGSKGDFENLEDHSYEWKRMYIIPSDLIRRGEDNVLAIRGKGYLGESSGLAIGPIKVGNFTQLNRAYLRENVRNLSFAFAYFVIAAYFIFFFIRRPSSKDYLLFGIFSFFLASYAFLRTDIRLELFPYYDLLKRLEHFALMPMVPLYTAFMLTFFKRKFTLFHKIYLALGALTLLVPILGDVTTYRVPRMIFGYPIWLTGIVIGTTVMVQEIMKKNRDAIYMSVSFVILILTAVNDTIVATYMLGLPLLLSYGFFAMILSMAGILANQFMRLFSEVEDLNENLEKKVEERTQQVRKLVEQQNGDYFLTSRLIEPLLPNVPQKEKVRIEVYLNQKKKYKFRKWEGDIGGDLCISHEMRLQDKDYVVFINGDAMGKSLQGAGGVLVMGSLFNMMVSRTQHSAADQSKSPAQWLNDCYNELESVFESFDGGMLMSAVIGLIDVESGELFYFNAEHPWTVLLRENSPRFMEQESHTGRKIGTVGFADVKILSFRLKPGDVLILGSDGRDDLLLSVDEVTGNRNINEDETLFLRFVKESGGNLNALVEKITEYGQLTDDLSLMKIEFTK